MSVIISSCATLGSKTHIYNLSELDKIKTVGLITRRSDQPRNIYHKMIKEAFTSNLIQKLTESYLFNIVILDTMENETLNINTLQTSENVDAYLLVDWKLRFPENYTSDAKVELSLLTKDSKELILMSSHNTSFGNSYWRTPILPKTLLDATDDAITTMTKHIKK